MTDDATPPERPRIEPEIIPPDRRSPFAFERDAFTHTRGRQRVYVTRIGPFGFALLFLTLAALAAAIFIAVLGAVLIWVPILALFVAIAVVFRFFRRF
ncbi:MAG TPA: hypothetical protein VGJ20_03055 [Xanthobacteraceae bacterium]|jgi:hypothetical protein